jgi:uncharacterized membrane-anchored protein
MKRSSRPAASADQPGVAGTARVDRRIGSALRRAHTGDIAVIDHLDLDRRAAEALLDHGVSAVVNASRFISGRYPNLGPELLARSGVVLVDDVGTEVFGQVKDGAKARIHDGTLYVADQAVATGHELSLDEVLDQMDSARDGLTTQLQSFTHNTTEFLRREQDLLLHGQGVPELQTPIEGRPVVVVSHGFEHEEDLRGLRAFIKEQKPVLIGVDAGADSLLEAKLRPDLVVVGDLGFTGGGAESRPVSDRALTSAGEVVVHADSSDRVVGADRLDRLGVRPQRIAAGGTTEDVALLIADLAGASVIVVAGGHATLDEFLDRHRSGLASSFLTRLRVGPRLVDARTAAQLFPGRAHWMQLLIVLVVGLAALGVALAATPEGQRWINDLQGLFS